MIEHVSPLKNSADCSNAFLPEIDDELKLFSRTFAAGATVPKFALYGGDRRGVGGLILRDLAGCGVGGYDWGHGQ